MAKKPSKKTKSDVLNTYKVSGKVLNSNEEPIPGQQVLVVDVDLRGAAIYRTASSLTELKRNGGFQVLGTAVTDDHGYYEVTFSNSSFDQLEIRLADVVSFAIDKETIVARSRLAVAEDYFNNVELKNWNIYLADSVRRGLSEYEKLITVIEPFAQSNKLQLFQLFVSIDQVAFLATETSQDRLHCAIAVQADNLCNGDGETKLSRELLYGIGRQRIALSWSSLLLRTVRELISAINRSIAENIIGRHKAAEINPFVIMLLELARERATKQEELQQFYKTLGLAIRDTELLKTVGHAYASFKGSSEEFWKLLSQLKGVTPEIIERLQLTNQLSALTAQHVPLIEELLTSHEIKNPIELLRFNKKDWTEILSKTGIPEGSTGNTSEEQLNSYLNGMLRVLHTSYPTQKISRMISDGELHEGDEHVKSKLVEFLDKDTGFDVSTSRIQEFKNVLLETTGEDLYKPVSAKLQLIQRIFQISPTPEIMNTLIANGYTSAHQIAMMSKRTFIEREEKSLGGSDAANIVYIMARHQVMRAQHVLLSVRDTIDNTTPSKIVSPSQRQSINSFINTIE